MMQTGRLFTGGVEHPHDGCVARLPQGRPRRDAGPRPAAQADRPHRRQPAARPDGRLPRQAVRPVRARTPTPTHKNFNVPDLLPPDYISSVRAGRRQKMRDAVEGELAAFEQQAQAKQTGRQFRPGLSADVEPPRPARRSPWTRSRRRVRDRYGRTRFGQSCLLARRLIERGVRFVTVNMFETVFDEITWDIHGSKPFTRHYGDVEPGRAELRPGLQRLAGRPARSRNVEDDDGDGAGRVRPDAEGEPGRRPRSPPRRVDDPHGRRADSRAAASSASRTSWGTSRRAGRCRPAEVAATMYQGLGFDPHRELPGPQNRPLPLADYNVRAIKELF